MTMFTGLYPKHHGVTRNRGLAEEVPTLADRLRQSGYLTAAFTGIGAWMSPGFGFVQGMDTYSFPLNSTMTEVRPVRRRPISTTLNELTHWLDAHPRTSPFVFFHNFDTHSHLFALETE